MEIRVIVRDAFAASDLTWYLDESARVSREDGVYVVRVQAGEKVPHVLSEIRNWLTLREVGGVTVHIGELEDWLNPAEVESGRD